MKIKFFLCLLISGLFIGNRLYGQIPDELIITEIMADPTPSHGLPEVEYLEIYNISEKSVRLSNYTLLYSRFTVKLPDTLLQAGEYAILVRNGNQNALLPYGKVVVVSQLSLVNAGTELVLQRNGQTVFSVMYSDKWYTADRNQGYSLEMIDLNYPCVEKNNWTSSKSTLGGTPGQPNASAATNPDNTPPELLFFDTDIPQAVTLTFNEKLDSTAFNATFVPEIPVRDVHFVTGGTVAVLQLTKPLPENQLTDLTLSDIKDCSGNVAETISVSLGNLPPADSGDVVLSEVLFNPKTGGGDFVELYNRSDKTVSLKNWKLANVNDAGEPASIRVISNNNVLFLPKSYLVLAEDKQLLSEYYPNTVLESCLNMERLPAFANTAGTVLLINAENDVFDRLDYDEDMHDEFIDDADGVSLEKSDFDKSSASRENWHSASAEAGYATPGYENSQSVAERNLAVTVEPKVFTPDGDGYHDVAYINYQFPEPANQATVRIFSSEGVLVKTLAENTSIGTQGRFEWDGRGNYRSGTLPVGYYLITFETFDAAGNTRQFREKVVLGRSQ